MIGARRARIAARRRQRGAFAVEAALALPILIGAGLLGADMQRIHTERIRLESTAGVVAVNLAAQRELTQGGLDELARIAMQGHENDQLMYLLSVRLDGTVAWGVTRGGAEGLCEAPAAGGQYLGTLPDDSRRGDDTAAPSMIVVRSCRGTGDVSLFSGLVLPDMLQTDTLFPATNAAITLDEPLQAESDGSGLARTDSQS
ncbi:Flp pilus assembly protein TadG [Bordetella ansorpii]|uniref:Flp pilus assembly protein TadG n=1 Tax=Bordetella ansorpii TaxID=288768 RepID=A0A157SXM1_9BORD|nr:hypothetical protein [Bordetella ansorpii]SAI74696.1 Flp pilus assembly protein TadG [Bordetella ansorpii]